METKKLPNSVYSRRRKFLDGTKQGKLPPQYLYIKRGKIPVLTTTKYRPEIIGIESRSRARRRPTLQNSEFVNRYSIF
jgi:hypothetical protein